MSDEREADEQEEDELEGRKRRGDEGRRAPGKRPSKWGGVLHWGALVRPDRRLSFSERPPGLGEALVEIGLGAEA